jgi:hypothetical protein
VSLSLGYVVVPSFGGPRRPSYWTHIPAESPPTKSRAWRRKLPICHDNSVLAGV